MNKMNKKGFTIVELVIVIAVIAILAGVLIPTFGGIIEKANMSAVQQEAAAAYKEVYALDLADGKVDGLDNKKTITLKDAKGVWSYDHDGATKFTYTNEGYKAEFDGTNWTVTEVTATESNTSSSNS